MALWHNRKLHKASPVTGFRGSSLKYSCTYQPPFAFPAIHFLMKTLKSIKELDCYPLFLILRPCRTYSSGGTKRDVLKFAVWASLILPTTSARFLPRVSNCIMGLVSVRHGSDRVALAPISIQALDTSTSLTTFSDRSGGRAD